MWLANSKKKVKNNEHQSLAVPVQLGEIPNRKLAVPLLVSVML